MTKVYGAWRWRQCGSLQREFIGAWTLSDMNAFKENLSTNLVTLFSSDFFDFNSIPSWNFLKFFFLLSISVHSSELLVSLNVMKWVQGERNFFIVDNKIAGGNSLVDSCCVWAMSCASTDEESRDGDGLELFLRALTFASLLIRPPIRSFSSSLLL